MDLKTFAENALIVGVSAVITYALNNIGVFNLGALAPFVVAGLTAFIHALNGMTGVGEKVKSMM